MRLLLATLLLSLFVGTSSASSSYRDWTLQCSKNQLCFIAQVLEVSNGKKTGVIGGLSVMSMPGNRLVLTIRTPQQADLSQGFGLKIDGNKAIRVKILTCDQSFCETHLQIDSKMLSEMKTGVKLGVVYIDKHNKQQRALPFSLDGFSQALKALQNKAGAPI